MIFYDKRGYLQTIHSKDAYPFDFVWEYVTKSYFGVLRGLHYQVEPKAQGKLVVCLSGRIYDVFVDLETGKWEGVWLNPGEQIYIPVGYAHGYQSVADESLVLYKCTEVYSPEHERGIIWNDSDLNIDWPIKNPVLSERDERWKTWTQQ